MNELKRLHLKIAKCIKCKAMVGYKKFPMLAHGTFTSKNVIISEAPGRDSVMNGRFWTGASGQLLRECLIEVDMDLERDFYVTDVVKCWPQNNGRNRSPSADEIDKCKPFIMKEIELIGAKNIFAFGETALRLFIWNKSVQLKDLHGKSFKLDSGITLYFFYHPSYVVSYNKNLEYEYRSKLVEAFRKLVSHS